MPSLSTTMAKFSKGEATAPKYFYKMKTVNLVDIIRYYYNSNPKGLTGFNKINLVENIMKLYPPTGTLFVLFCGYFYLFLSLLDKPSKRYVRFQPNLLL